MTELAQLLRFAAPVAYAAIGESVGQKAGVINIGLEGMMLSASFAAAMVAVKSGSWALGLVAGVLVGLVLAICQGIFVVGLAVDQVIAGTALNLIALGATNAAFRSTYGQSGSLVSAPTMGAAGGFDALMALLPVAALLASWAIYRTPWGLAARAAGSNPEAAAAAGLSVRRLRYQALAVGGLCAGLAGSYLALGINGSFAENMTAGRGFMAIAVVTFGRWKPIWAVLASLLIGYAESLQFTFQAKGLAVPYQLLIAMPYVVALAVLVVAGKGAAAPAALGRPYRGAG